MKTYYLMLEAGGEKDAVGKMKQFATYFTHGVRNGSKLRTEIYRTQDARGILDIVDAFFEEQLTSGAACAYRLAPSQLPRLVVPLDPARPAEIVKHVQLITDGACIGNPGPGGWAFILRYGELKREGFGSEPHTTNNRMELTAAIEGLKRLKEDCAVEIVTDSQYMKNGITQWIKGWKKNGWKTASKQPVVKQGFMDSARGTGSKTRDHMEVDERPCVSRGQQPL